MRQAQLGLNSATWEVGKLVGWAAFQYRRGVMLDIAMTLSLTRPYPDPTRCRVGSDPL
jgi:hypothetical protein